MSTIITRLYRSQTAAKSVTDALKEAGFLDSHMDTFSGGGTKAANDDEDGKTKKKSKSKASGEAMAAKLMKAGVYPKAAETYAEHLASGETLVVLRAPFRTSLTGSFTARNSMLSNPSKLSLRPPGMKSTWTG